MSPRTPKIARFLRPNTVACVKGIISYICGIFYIFFTQGCLHKKTAQLGRVWYGLLFSVLTKACHRDVWKIYYRMVPAIMRSAHSMQDFFNSCIFSYTLRYNAEFITSCVRFFLENTATPLKLKYLRSA